MLNLILGGRGRGHGKVFCLEKDWLANITCDNCLPPKCCYPFSTCYALSLGQTFCFVSPPGRNSFSRHNSGRNENLEKFEAKARVVLTLKPRHGVPARVCPAADNNCGRRVNREGLRNMALLADLDFLQISLEWFWQNMELGQWHQINIKKRPDWPVEWVERGSEFTGLILATGFAAGWLFLVKWSKRVGEPDCWHCIWLQSVQCTSYYMVNTYSKAHIWEVSHFYFITRLSIVVKWTIRRKKLIKILTSSQASKLRYYLRSNGDLYYIWQMLQYFSECRLFEHGAMLHCNIISRHWTWFCVLAQNIFGRTWLILDKRIPSKLWFHL